MLRRERIPADVTVLAEALPRGASYESIPGKKTQRNDHLRTVAELGLSTPVSGPGRPRQCDPPNATDLARSVSHPGPIGIRGLARSASRPGLIGVTGVAPTTASP